MQERQVRSLGQEDPLEKERLPTSVFWPGEFRGVAELDTTRNFHFHFTFCFTSLLLDSGMGIWFPNNLVVFTVTRTLVYFYFYHTADRFSRGCLPPLLPMRNSRPTVPLRWELHLTLHPPLLAGP